jgi:signal transduction histidine kinase
VALGFRGKLLASYLALVAVAAGSSFVVLDQVLGADLEERLDDRLESQVAAAAEWLRVAGRPERLANKLARVVDARVIVLEASGGVIGDSAPAEGPLAGLDADARAASWGTTRLEIRAGRGGAYYTVLGPIDIERVVALAVPMEEAEWPRHSLRIWLGVIASGGFLLATLLALIATRIVSRPLRGMVERARRVGQGDYRIGPALDAPDELGLLSRTLVSLAEQVEGRVADVERERDEVRRLETVRRDFVANLAHELRTPVTSIRGYAETLAAGKVDATTQREFLAIVHRNAVRIGRLVDDLLTLQELDARRGPPTAARVEVADVAAEVVRTLGGQASAAGVALELEVPADLEVLADPDELERVVLNLTDNAIKYGAAGGLVRIAATARGDRVELVVEDRGEGIPAAARERVFERFFRLDEGRSRDRGGTGLGLAIVRHLAEVMGGKVRVEEASPRGARFVVTLRRAS